LFPVIWGIRKALSICGSHLTVVSLFCRAILSIYMHLLSLYSLQNILGTVIFTVGTRLLNPFIYSLRNCDMKQAIRKLIIRKLVLPNF
jgi:olfactory receptor